MRVESCPPTEKKCGSSGSVTAVAWTAAEDAGVGDGESDGEGAGDLPALMAAHAVGHGVDAQPRAHRLLHGLANYLSAFLPPPEGLLRTAAMAVVADGEAVLVPGSLLSAVKLVQPRLHRAGFQIADVPVTLLAPDTAELVVPEPAVTVDEAVIEGVGGGSPTSEPRPAPRDDGRGVPPAELERQDGGDHRRGAEQNARGARQHRA